MLYIIGTGGSLSPDLFDQERSKVRRPFEFNSQCTIVHDAYFYADCRLHQSKRNREFGYAVIKAVDEGKDVILVVPDSIMIDKRLREHAVIIQLRPYKDLLKEEVEDLV